MINTLGQVILSLLAELKIFHSNLAHKLEILFKLLPLGKMIIVKFHPGDVRISSRTDPERRHATTVDVQRTVWEEVQEQAIIWLLWVCNVLGEVVLVVHTIESWRVVNRERRMGVLAVQALLISVHPTQD